VAAARRIVDSNVESAGGDAENARRDGRVWPFIYRHFGSQTRLPCGNAALLIHPTES